LRASRAGTPQVAEGLLDGGLELRSLERRAGGQHCNVVSWRRRVAVLEQLGPLFSERRRPPVAREHAEAASFDVEVEVGCLFIADV